MRVKTTTPLFFCSSLYRESPGNGSPARAEVQGINRFLRKYTAKRAKLRLSFRPLLGF